MATEILRPNADGDDTNLTPSAGIDHFSLVNEEIADDDSTYVYKTGVAEEYIEDRLVLQSSSLSNIEITKITVHARVKGTGTIYLNLYNTLWYQTEKYETIDYADWTNISKEWEVNDQNGDRFQISDIYGAIFGVYNGDGYCTQLYIEIEYFNLATSEWGISIKSSQREIYYKADVFFASDSPTEFDMTVICNSDLLEELFAEGSTPLGAVSSNEFTLYLNNEDGDFSALNTSSPYYGKLVPNIKIIPYVGIKLADDSIEYIRMGIFYTSNWEAPTDSIIASVVCHDSLWDIANRPMPQIPVIEDVNYSTLFKTIFKALGLTDNDYEVDDISWSCDIVAIPEGPEIKVRDGLQALSEGGLCNVFIDRNNKIRVLRNNNVEAVSHAWYDTDLIISGSQPVDYTKIYSQVELTYHIPYIGASTSVLTLSDLIIPTGTNNFNNLVFSSSCGAVENVQLIGATNSYISSMTIGANSISLVIINSGAEETIDIEVTGKPITTIDAKYTASDATTQALIGNVKLSLDNDYIQDKSDAILYTVKALNLVIDPAAYVYIKSWGDPSILLTNSMEISDVIDNIYQNIIPLRMFYNFTDGIECDMYAIKKSIREAC